VYNEGVRPYIDRGDHDYEEAWDRRRKQPMRDFMFAQIEATGNWSGVYMMLNYRGVDTSDPASLTRADVDMLSLVPAYILSELKVAFLIGLPDLPAVPRDRHGDREHADLDGHADAAAGADLAAVQVAAVRAGGRLAARGGHADDERRAAGRGDPGGDGGR
jgi:hypothetical protein